MGPLRPITQISGATFPACEPVRPWSLTLGWMRRAMTDVRILIPSAQHERTEYFDAGHGRDNLNCTPPKLFGSCWSGLRLALRDVYGEGHAKGSRRDDRGTKWQGRDGSAPMMASPNAVSGEAATMFRDKQASRHEWSLLRARRQTIVGSNSSPSAELTGTYKPDRKKTARYFGALPKVSCYFGHARSPQPPTTIYFTLLTSES